MVLNLTRVFCLFAFVLTAYSVQGQTRNPEQAAQDTPPAEAEPVQAESAGEVEPVTGEPGAAAEQAAQAVPDEALLVVAGDPEAGQAKAAICATCHGPGGNSTNPAWPKLAGQHADYIVTELKAYQSGARQDPLMSPQATTLTEQDMVDLAAYYSRQSIRPGVADESLVDAGQELYLGGNPETAVPACIACHGPAGRGIPASGFPMVGGQHALYALTALQAYASGQRQSKSGIMNDIAGNMSEAEMQAVASYLEGLHLNEAAFKQTR